MTVERIEREVEEHRRRKIQEAIMASEMQQRAEKEKKAHLARIRQLEEEAFRRKQAAKNTMSRAEHIARWKAQYEASRPPPMKVRMVPLGPNYRERRAAYNNRVPAHMREYD